jgi:hypothetical protein
MKKLLTKKAHKNQRTPELTILLAAQNPDPAVMEMLSEVDHLQIKEAFTTRGVIQNLQNVHLVITGDLLSTADVHEEMMEWTLEQSGLPVVSQVDFLSDPQEWLDQARLSNAREIAFLPSRQINMMSWAGGVGKTTLAMAVCKRFAQKTGLPTMLVEICLGPSALETIIHEPLSTFFTVISGMGLPGQWEGVTVLPMDDDGFEVVWEDDAIELLDYLSDLRKKYTLVVVDAHSAHQLIQYLGLSHDDMMNIVVANPREDALQLGRNLFDGLPGNKHLIMNMSKKIADRMESGISLVLPHKENWAAAYDARLADPILELVYPNWGKGK